MKYLLFVCFLFLFNTTSNSQVCYFTYKYVNSDTMKSDNPLLVKHAKASIRLPLVKTGYKTYIRYKNYIFQVDYRFSKEFENTPEGDTKFETLKQNIPNSGMCMKGSFISVLNLRNMIKYIYNDSSYCRVFTIPKLKQTPLPDGKVKYSVNDDFYFVVQKGGDTAVNPGIFSPDINGSILEIKTRYYHYTLESYKNLDVSPDEKNLQIELSFIKFDSPPIRSVYPFLYEDKSIPPFNLIGFKKPVTLKEDKAVR